MFSVRTAVQISNCGDVPENRKSHSYSTKRLSKFEFRVGFSYITAELTLSVCGETAQQIPGPLTNKLLVGNAVPNKPEVGREDTCVISAISTWCICSCKWEQINVRSEMHTLHRCIKTCSRIFCILVRTRDICHQSSTSCSTPANMNRDHEGQNKKAKKHATVIRYTGQTNCSLLMITLNQLN